MTKSDRAKMIPKRKKKFRIYLASNEEMAAKFDVHIELVEAVLKSIENIKHIEIIKEKDPKTRQQYSSRYFRFR